MGLHYFTAPRRELQGVNPQVVSERLGHASGVITLDTYSHVLPNLREEAVAKFETAMAVAAGV